MTAIATEATAPMAVATIPVDQLTIGLDFRLDEDTEDLADLAASISEVGVLQPLVVRQTDAGWEVVAGRRRLAAARVAGVREVPCIIRSLTHDQAADVALAENLHRRDLSPVEVAMAFARLRDQGLNQPQIAARVGRSTSTVNQLLRLLEIPAKLRNRVHRRELSYKTALDLAGRRSYTPRKEPGTRGTLDAGLDAEAVTYWRRRHDRLVAGLQRIRRAKADGINLAGVITLVDRLIDTDMKPLPAETAKPE